VHDGVAVIGLVPCLATAARAEVKLGLLARVDVVIVDGHVTVAVSPLVCVPPREAMHYLLE
jgi:hypothetical protein